jgi:menaquinone-dependent protoporphyrinogen oxidase
MRCTAQSDEGSRHGREQARFDPRARGDDRPRARGARPLGRARRHGRGDDLSGYDAYVIGSGIYLGNWLKETRRFIDALASELTRRPTWLLASGSIVGEPPLADDPNALRAGLVERLVETTNAREHKLFAGKLDLSKLGLLEKAAVRGAHASEGDYRDWDDAKRWATEIAAELSAEQTSSSARR